MRQRTLIALALAGLMAACDSTPSTPTPAPAPTPPAPTPQVQSVTVAPSSASVQAGQTTTLTATVNADAGVTNRSVTWSSSDTAIATVNADGVVTGVAAGSATIRATSAANTSISGTSAITVTPRPTVITDFNGVFEGRGGSRNEGCGMGEPGNMRATVTLDANGNGTMLVWHDGNAFTTRYEVTPANARLSGSTLTFRFETSDSVVNGSYGITFLGSMTPTEMNVEELFANPGICETRYAANLRRR